MNNPLAGQPDWSREFWRGRLGAENESAFFDSGDDDSGDDDSGDDDSGDDDSARGARSAFEFNPELAGEFVVIC
jgi:hypothetical protein